MPLSAEEASRLLESLKGGASLEQLQGLLQSLNLELPGDAERSTNSSSAGAPEADADQDDAAEAPAAEAAAAPKDGDEASNSSIRADAAAAGRTHLDRVDGDSRLLIQRAEPDASPLVSAKSW